MLTDRWPVAAPHPLLVTDTAFVPAVGQEIVTWLPVAEPETAPPARLQLQVAAGVQLTAVAVKISGLLVVPVPGPSIVSWPPPPLPGPTMNNGCLKTTGGSVPRTARIAGANWPAAP